MKKISRRNFLAGTTTALITTVVPVGLGGGCQPECCQHCGAELVELRMRRPAARVVLRDGGWENLCPRCVLAGMDTSDFTGLDVLDDMLI